MRWRWKRWCGVAALRRGRCAVDEPAADTLLALPLGEVLRLGLVSNRGMIVVGAALPPARRSSVRER